MTWLLPVRRLNGAAAMKRQWRVRRQPQPHSNAQQRWDRAYHLLAEWAQQVVGGPAGDVVGDDRPVAGGRGSCG